MPMTSVDELRRRLQRRWDRGEFLGDTPPVGDDGQFPLRVPTGSASARLIRDDFDTVLDWAAAYRQLGDAVEWTLRRDRTVGEVRLPAAVGFADIDHLARFLGRDCVAHLKRFRAVATEVLEALPELRGGLGTSPHRILVVADDTPLLIAVTRWYRDHPRSGAYLRQIPVPGIDTKFVERHRGLLSQWWEIIADAASVASGRATDSPADGTDTPAKPPADAGNACGAERPASPDASPVDPAESGGFPVRFGFRDRPRLVRFRVLDPDRPIAGFRDLTVPVEELTLARPEGIDRVFVVENDVTALAFPQAPRSIVIFGRGFRVGEIAAVSWLAEVEVVYTGDLDTHGFAILNRARAHLPHLRSILMDSDTLLSHRAQWSHENVQTTADLPFLTPSEQATYDALRYNRYSDGVRLEQERISFDRIVEAVGNG